MMIQICREVWPWQHSGKTIWGGGQHTVKSTQKQLGPLKGLFLLKEAVPSIPKTEIEKTASTSAGHVNSSIPRNHVVSIFHRLSVFGSWPRPLAPVYNVLFRVHTSESVRAFLHLLLHYHSVARSQVHAVLHTSSYFCFLLLVLLSPPSIIFLAFPP